MMHIKRFFYLSVFALTIFSINQIAYSQFGLGNIVRDVTSGNAPSVPNPRDVAEQVTGINPASIPTPPDPRDVIPNINDVIDNSAQTAVRNITGQAAEVASTASNLPNRATELINEQVVQVTDLGGRVDDIQNRANEIINPQNTPLNISLDSPVIDIPEVPSVDSAAQIAATNTTMDRSDLFSNPAPQPGDADFVGPLQQAPQPGDSDFIGPVAQAPQPGDPDFVGPLSPAEQAALDEQNQQGNSPTETAQASGNSGLFDNKAHEYGQRNTKGKKGGAGGLGGLLSGSGLGNTIAQKLLQHGVRAVQDIASGNFNIGNFAQGLGTDIALSAATGAVTDAFGPGVVNEVAAQAVNGGIRSAASGQNPLNGAMSSAVSRGTAEITNAANIASNRAFSELGQITSAQGLTNVDIPRAPASNPPSITLDDQAFINALENAPRNAVDEIIMSGNVQQGMT